MAATHYVYHLDGLTKIYPGGKKVFENIWLHFLPDAKIGVVGVNGSGKSTLLKIMAGEDHEILGEAKAADGLKIGYLPQEPKLDPTQDGVREHRRQMPREADGRRVQRHLGQARRGIFRRADGEDDEAPGGDRRRRRLGHRRQDRDGDGGAALPAGRLPTSPSSRAARSAASPSARCCCRSPTCS